MKTILYSLLFCSTGSSISSQPQSLRSNNRNNERKLNEDTFIFNTVSDGYAKGIGDKVGKSCSTDDRWVSFVVNDDGNDYIDIATTKWHSGGYRMDCVDKGAHTGWQCAATCSPYPNPNFMEWGYLTFEARVTGTFDSICKPTIGVTKRWPSYSSNVLALEGEYVDGGSLQGTEWKRVVIPMADFATAEWPSVNGVKDVNFRNCGTNYSVNPHYQVRFLLLTDTPPAITTAQVTPNPTNQLTSSPITSEPSTSSPTTSEPSTSSPSFAMDAYWPVWEDVDDSNTIEDPSYTCFAQQIRLGITTTNNEFDDYFTITSDAWVSGGLMFGCQTKNSNYACTHSCYPFDGTSPNWSEKTTLTFLAKIEGVSPGCTPSIGVTGGGWPRKNSNKIYLEGSYVDAGSLSSSEFRRVAIPINDMKTAEWDMSNLFGLYFHTCGFDEGGSSYPYLTYHVASLAVTNDEVELVSMPPTNSPTEYVTESPSLATHEHFHHVWLPLQIPDESWHVAENNMWPMLFPPPPHTATVHIPQGQTVVFSGSEETIFDKIIVEGSLEIRPVDANVKLIAGTIMVLQGGSLDISTSSDSPYTVTVEIDGALDQVNDPEELLVGIVAANGHLTIEGHAVTTKMAPLLQTASASSNTLDIDGDFDVGGELVLPDTQEGLHVSHWNFPNNENYVDQTEHCIITSIAGSIITCDAPLIYDHSIGSYSAYVTRSVIIKTSPESTDRGHILHTGTGAFEVRNARIENFGRTTTDLIDSTVMSPDPELNFEPGLARMIVSYQGTNQIARYALHAHHSLVEAYFTGNAILHSPRDGCVAHNSRVHILGNVVIDADGTGIFLEDATETGPVVNNYIIGTGKGTRGGDDGRFSSQLGKDMAHGGFGVWARGKLALIQGNHAEGHFGVAPYAFFVHPNFISDHVVPDVPGTPAEVAGKKLKDIHPTNTNGLQLQSYGGFVNNTAVATFRVGLDMSYFSVSTDDDVGSIIQGANVRNLAMSGRGLSTTHSRVFTLQDVTIEGTVEGNTIVGIWCNNCDSCTLQTPNTTLVIDNVETIRGGNC